MNGTLHFRADADATIGTGHVMRCIALGQEWRRTVGRPVTFLGRIDSSALHERIRLEGFSSIEMPAVHPDDRDACFVREILARAGHDGPHWLVVDGYHFDSAYQEKISGGNSRILVIDDHGLLPEYHCDILLNQNIYAKGLSYRGMAGMVRLLGPRYAMLRTEFRQVLQWDREAPSVARKILVTLGGADPQNVTPGILAALAQLHIPDLHVKAVIGAANRHEASLSALVNRLPLRCELIRATNDMAGLMQWADAAVTAAGTTTYELAASGVPFLTLVIADNQEENARHFAEQGVASNMGRFEALSPAQFIEQLRDLLHDIRRRRAQSQAGQNLVDGRGAERVVAAMLSFDISLQKARWSDRDLLLEWANDPQTRSNSFNSVAILRDEHEKWLAAKLKDPHCVMYVASDHQAVPIGVTRFDVEGDKALISINLTGHSRGKGLGSRIIAEACGRLFDELPVEVVEARIKEENIASLRAFRKAGFAAAGKAMQSGVPAVIMHFHRSHRERD